MKNSNVAIWGSVVWNNHTPKQGKQTIYVSFHGILVADELICHNFWTNNAILMQLGRRMWDFPKMNSANLLQNCIICSKAMTNQLISHKNAMKRHIYGRRLRLNWPKNFLKSSSNGKVCLFWSTLAQKF